MKKPSVFIICFFNTKTVQWGWFRWKCLQYARANCFNCSG